MEVFRIASGNYSKTLTASGKKARWNRDNQFTLYTGQHRSLSSLELVVHQRISSVLKYEVMVIHLADRKNLYTKIDLKDLPKNWKETLAYPTLQDIGSDWYENHKSLILQVPSVIIPQEYNYIINTTHADYKKENIRLLKTKNSFGTTDSLPLNY